MKHGLTPVATPASEEERAEAMAQALRLPKVRLAATMIFPEAVAAIPEDLARRAKCIGIRKEDPPSGRPGRATLVVAMADPHDIATIDAIEFAAGCKVKPVVVTRTEIQDAIDRHYSSDRYLQSFLRNVSEDGAVPLDLHPVEHGDANDGAPAVRLANLLIQAAIRLDASDLHIEPTLHSVEVRVRAEGLLREYARFPKWLHEQLVSRIKILANLNITERRRAQDGRIRVSSDGGEVDLRVSTLPTNFGEKVVLRLLVSGKFIPLEGLSITPEDMQIIKRALDQPQGMVLVTGPTGSGKTTTLYSALHYRQSPTINIVTVEDPIEIQMPGINQVQVNTKTGMTFASCLRSILRQDPDVILVGEIRDRETQEIAFHAALTGHLVLTTIHTNSTTATVARLIDLGVDPYVLIDAVNVIVAQRLLRRNCPNCLEPYHPDPAVLSRLQLSASDIYRHGRGCNMCADTGYTGRFAIVEVLRITPAIRDLIIRKASESELRRAAAQAGTLFLVERGIAKVREGVTTAEELVRVLQLEDQELKATCPECSRDIDPQFVRCPYCLHVLRRQCASCHQELQKEWRLCPYCDTPVVDEEISPPPQYLPPVKSAPAALSAPHELRILIADDDRLARTRVVHALSSLPFRAQITEAEDGEHALEAIRQRGTDMVILDRLMPGMTGVDVCQELRKNVKTAFIPVLMLTADTDEEHRAESYLVGTDDYMTKPYSIDELKTRVIRLARRTYGI